MKFLTPEQADKTSNGHLAARKFLQGTVVYLMG